MTWCLDHFSLEWRNNGRDGVSNHRGLNGLLNRLFRRRSKKTSKLCVTGLCEGNSPVTGEFPSQRANNADFFPIDDVIMYDGHGDMFVVPQGTNICTCIYFLNLKPNPLYIYNAIFISTTAIVLNGKKINWCVNETRKIFCEVSLSYTQYTHTPTDPRDILAVYLNVCRCGYTHVPVSKILFYLIAGNYNTWQNHVQTLTRGKFKDLWNVIPYSDLKTI